MVELWPFKPKVLGSNPSISIFNFRPCSLVVKHAFDKRKMKVQFLPRSYFFFNKVYEVQEFSIVFLYLIIGLILAFVLVKVSQIIAFQSPDIEKLSQYECGFQHISDIYSPLDLHFFRVCILFLIFDVELSLLFPFSYFYDLHIPDWNVRISLLIFTFFLALSFYYETWEEMLDWTRPYKAM